MRLLPELPGPGGRGCSLFSPRGAASRSRVPWKLPLFLPAACGAAPGQSCPGAPCPHSGVLGQSSAPSGQAAWLFLAVVPGVASLLLFNALGAPGLAAPLPFPNAPAPFSPVQLSLGEPPAPWQHRGDPRGRGGAVLTPLLSLAVAGSRRCPSCTGTWPWPSS